MRVSPDHHRRGFGTAILETLEARARDDGFERIILDTTPRQEAAVAFYDAHGYELWRCETLEMLYYEKASKDDVGRPHVYSG